MLAKKGGKFKNGQHQLELLKEHCNGSLCSLKMVTVQKILYMFFGTKIKRG